MGDRQEQGAADESGNTGGYFPPTQWTLVTRAVDGENEEAAAVAMEELCARYWYPMYSFVRSRGLSKEDAEDRVQGLFAHLLSRESLGRVRQERGKLRSFLLAAMKHHLHNEHRAAEAQKRGGGITVIALDADRSEGWAPMEIADGETIEKAFEREWARELLERARVEARAGYESRGKEGMFDALVGFLPWNAKEDSYEEVGAKLGLSDGALRVNVFRMRERYRKALEKEIAETVETPEEIEEEVAFLFAAFQG